MSNHASSSEIPSIACTDYSEQELKIQDHHQLDVHIPEEGVSHVPSLDPILESSNADLPSMPYNTEIENLEYKDNTPALDDTLQNCKLLGKDEESDEEKEEKLKKKSSFNSQRAVWHGHSMSDSPFEILDSSETPIPIKKPTFFKKVFKGDGDSSKHDGHAVNQENSNSLHTNLKHDDQESLNSNVSIGSNSGNHHPHIQMVHYPEAREHWVTKNHREHKHESLLSKFLHSVKHETADEIKGEHEIINASARGSTCEEPGLLTSTSSVETTDGLLSVISKKNPPSDVSKTENSFTQTMSRLLSKKKKHTEEREMTSNLIKEFVLAQNQIQRSDSQTSQLTNNSIMSAAANSDVCLSEKYGHLEEVLGKGAQATVRLAHLHKANTADKLWAVKEFRKKKKDESNRDYAKRVVSEFCISSTMKHENVIETVDLIKDEHGKWCEVMEYVPGGDMFNKISNGKFHSSLEIACFFKQFLSGLKYIHSVGVAHRDLKPENILLDAKHELLKITDFGVADIIRSSNEKEHKLSRGIAGSDPYIAPEMWDYDEYDAFKTDCWSSGILLYVMYTKTILWRAAKSTDDGFKVYKNKKTDTCVAIEKLPYECRSTIYSLLEPDPAKRSTISEVLENDWMETTEQCSCKCTASSDGSRFMHRHAGPGQL